MNDFNFKYSSAGRGDDRQDQDVLRKEIKPKELSLKLKELDSGN